MFSTSGNAHPSNKCVFQFQLYKSYEQAKQEVEKLREELYPNLFAEASNEPSDNPNLDTIPEDANEHTDTNDFTEDTSEAQGSDDEVRGRNLDEDENTDAGESLDEVRGMQIYMSFG